MKISKELLLIPLIILIVWGAKKLYQAPAFSNGVPAPDFVGYKPNGDSLRLSNFEGQLVLLEFWGSWCGPCRQHNKKIVPLYHKYKDAKFKNATKFNIISVGVETQKKRWLAAIKKDKLVWDNHISDIKRLNDHVALKYGVREIPTSYLLDANRQIIGVNLSGEELDEILTQRQVE